MKNCKSLSALREYFAEKEDTDIEAKEDIEVVRLNTILSFSSEQPYTKSIAN